MRSSVSYFTSRRSLIEGPGSADSGAWPISWHRVAKGWGMLPEAYWPDQGAFEGTVVQGEPANADAIAKHHRIAHYQRIRSELECVVATTSPLAVAATLEINSSWRDPPDGRIELNFDMPTSAVHCIALASFDFERNCFVFPNSWGEDWGMRGIGFLPSGYLDRYMIEAWSMSPRQVLEQSPRPGIYYQHNEVNDSTFGIPLIVDIRDGDDDMIVGWGHAVQKRASLDVEEVFVRPEYRGKGYGTAIAKEFIALAAQSERNLPVRFWVPWGDHCELNTANLIHWAKKQQLQLAPSGVRWASYLATPGEPVDALPNLEWIPPKATAPLHTLNDPAQRVAVQESSWDEAKDARRAMLIEKEYRHSLTRDELLELEALQEEFGRHQDVVAPLPPSELEDV